MLLSNKKMPIRETGMSLVEILVGLIIGMLATLVIMQVFAAFEGQKRTTMGGADAQTNGSIALFSMQREVQMAGFGLPIFDKANSPLGCTTSPLDVDHDGSGATPNIGIFPISILDGGTAAGASDSITIRYSTDGATAKNGVSVKIVSLAGAVAGVDNNLGCNNGDVVIVSSGATCAMSRVDDADLAVDMTHITLKDAVNASYVAGSLACMGNWNQFEYSIADNQLQRRDASQAKATPVISDIVNIQAQYGVSDAGLLKTDPLFNKVTQWVDAGGATWGTAITVADRNRIKAVRIAVVARNGLLEKNNVTASCTTAKGTVNNGPCAWDDTNVSAAPSIDLSNDANWQRYRYRVYETIIPLRNLVWYKNT